MRRLRRALGPGAALQYVSGKQYPGEQLPRWALLCALARGRRAVWRDPALLAADDDVDTATAADAQRFCAALAERLQVDPSLINPAYEDVHYYLWREQRLPANVLAEDAKLGDPMERARLARVFGQGLDAPVGCVLPLRRAIRDERARLAERASGSSAATRCSCSRAIRRSAFGCRSTACPGPSRTQIEHETEPDPFAPHAPLPPRQAFSPCRPRDPWAPAPRRSVPSRRNFRWSAAASRIWCAPRSASSRATASSTSSSRRCTRRRTGWR